MAIIRKLFYIALSLVLLFALIGLFLPDHARIERSQLIQADATVIFPRLNSMKAFNTWSPWAGPNTEYRFEGPETGVGSRMVWGGGDSGVSIGSQTITHSSPNERIETAFDFGEDNHGSAEFLLRPEADNTRVVWIFESDFGWDLFSRYVGLFLENMIGGNLEKGLQSLKQQVEKNSH